MKSILFAALLVAAPLAASAQGLVVNDVYVGPGGGTYGAASQLDTPPVFAYPTTGSYCPSGLVPVQVGMEVSCGTPNVTASAADWNRHVATRSGYRYSSPEVYGAKGY